MKLCAGVFLALSLFSLNSYAAIRGNAVQINIGSMGTGGVGPTVDSVRKIIGHAVGSGIVDNFVVLSPRKDGPIPLEGGLTACAEAGFGTDNWQFFRLYRQLRSIKPSPGVYINVEMVENCNIKFKPIGDVYCTDDVRMCPDGSYVSRQPPSCSFAQCPIRLY